MLIVILGQCSGGEFGEGKFYMRSVKRYSPVKIAALVALVGGLVVMLAFSALEPLTPFDQQAEIGAILLIGALGLWAL